MKKSLKQILLDHWKEKGGFIAGGEGERIAEYEGMKASNASRRLRELCSEGLLIRELRPMRKGGKTVYYRYEEPISSNINPELRSSFLRVRSQEELPQQCLPMLQLR